MLKPTLIAETTVIDEDHPSLSRTERLWEWDDGKVTKSSHYAYQEQSAINPNGKAFNRNTGALIVAAVFCTALLVKGAAEVLSMVF